LKFFAVDRLEPAACLTQQQDLRRVVNVLDEVIHAAIVVECVVELKLPLAARLVDQRDVLWMFLIFSQTFVSAVGRDGLVATS
jgi:hypothetical protein